MSVSLINGHIDPDKNPSTDCNACKYFVLCDLAKQAFYKITGTPCREFEKAGEGND